jgi:hypothetical protein
MCVCVRAESSRQFALVERQIQRIKSQPLLLFSPIIIMCERNLGFEAEHHERTLHGIPHTGHRIDHAAKRYDVLTTETINHDMCTLTNTMLREQCISIVKPLISEDHEDNLRRLHEQLTVYSLQFKEAHNVFGKTRATLSGKVGGMKDDVVIAMQLGIFYSAEPHMYKHT